MKSLVEDLLEIITNMKGLVEDLLEVIFGLRYLHLK
jgi:hypothetical protein